MEILHKVVLLSWMITGSMVSPESQADQLLEKVLRCASMPRERIDAAAFLVEDLQRVLQELWPGSKVVQFGSLVADVAIRTSDVDCFVQLPNGDSYYTVYEAKDHIATHSHTFQNIYIIPNASVPIVQFTHISTGHRCDLNFRSPDGIVQSKMLKYLLHLDERARKLAIIVKYWAHINKPPRARRFMPNYGLVLLVIFFLQQKYVLPPIIKLQENSEKVSINNWEMGFNEIPYRSPNKDTLFELLSGFFKFYASFDFENNIISTFNGTTIERKMFENLDTVPQIYNTYKRNVGNNLTRPLNINTSVCIQNFFDHRKNIGVATTPELLDQFRSNLKFAAESIADFRNNSLRDIFNEDCFRNSEYHIKEYFFNLYDFFLCIFETALSIFSNLDFRQVFADLQIRDNYYK